MHSVCPVDAYVPRPIVDLLPFTRALHRSYIGITTTLKKMQKLGNQLQEKEKSTPWQRSRYTL